MIEFRCTQKDCVGEIDSEILYKIRTDMNIQEIVEEFKRFLLATSFTSKTVDKVQVIEEE